MEKRELATWSPRATAVVRCLDEPLPDAAAVFPHSLEPWQIGHPGAALIHGGHQERNRRAGTHNVAGIAGLGKACELAGEHLEANAVHMRRLRDKLEQGIMAQVPDIKLNGHPNPDYRLPNTLNISFAFIEGPDNPPITDPSKLPSISGIISHIKRLMGSLNRRLTSFIMVATRKYISSRPSNPCRSVSGTGFQDWVP